eukprot:TRINITY_DN14781_c0_g1_i1.p3 TRINITY_DN14781_c0_g1~~TRINITY_DN14781_c0_g1_i1.p3  ORF type:complete len:199 (+),score=22.01 TRINITY_DN14781_c0_g1_i1:64-597(+)
MYVQVLGGRVPCIQRTRITNFRVTANRPGDFSNEQMRKSLDTQVKRSKSKPVKQVKKVQRSTTEGTPKTAVRAQPNGNEDSKKIQKELQVRFFGSNKQLEDYQFTGRQEMMPEDQVAAALKRQTGPEGESQPTNENGVDESPETPATPPPSPASSSRLVGTELPDGTIMYTAEELQK